MFCICIEVYQIYESGDFDKVYEILSKSKKSENQNKQYFKKNIKT